MAKQIIMSQESLDELEAKLEHYKTVKRKDVAEKIKVALSFGDLSENSEYDEAKNEQGLIESQIAEMELTLSNALVLDSESLTTEMVQVGNKVKLKKLSDNSELDLQIVSSKEVDMLKGKISDESPIGKACMGHKVGEIVEAEAPVGNISYEIIEISK